MDLTSIEAALAAESVYRQNSDKFWEFKHEIYQNQGDEGEIWATEEYLLNLVTRKIEGLDLSLLKNDLKEHSYLLDVKEDFKVTAANGVYGTPTFIVNGVKVNGDYNELKTTITQQLK